MFQEQSLFHVSLMSFLATIPFQSMILCLVLKPFVSSVKHVIIHGAILERAYIGLKITENVSPDSILITFQMARTQIGLTSNDLGSLYDKRQNNMDT